MIDLASTLDNMPARRGDPPWSGYEYVKGWGVMGLPFDSGHVLALRIFPENDFAAFRSIWHRDPAGDWAIYVDGPRLDAACPRYFGPACTAVAHARIHVEWVSSASVRVAMEEPNLDWTLTVKDSWTLRVLNATSSRLPLWTWRSSRSVKVRELVARRVLGMGSIRLSGTTPSGHHVLQMPECMYFVDSSTAFFEGRSLGYAARVSVNPQIGQILLPTRGVLATGRAAWLTLDPMEYARTRAETQAAL